MTSNESSADRPPQPPRPGMLVRGTLGLLACAVAVAYGGWLLLTGVLRLNDDEGGSNSSLLYAIGGGFLLLLGVVCIAGAWMDLSTTHRWLLPLPTVLLLAAACALLGVGVADWTPQPWLLTPAVVTALVAAVLTPRLWRERRREVVWQWRRSEQGITARGTITDLEGGVYPDQGSSKVRLMVRFTATDGVGYTGRGTKEFPWYDLPRRGTAVTVRYLPEDPRDLEIVEVDRPLLPPNGAGAKAGATPLADELERLAALHEAGSLTDEEFSLAKARLLGGRD